MPCDFIRRPIFTARHYKAWLVKNQEVFYRLSDNALGNSRVSGAKGGVPFVRSGSDARRRNAGTFRRGPRRAHVPP